MESSKFHFRDHREFQSSMHSEPSSFVSSVSSDRDSDPEIESITGRGIKHLCSELLELKEEASEELQINIFANYSAFIRVLEEVKGVENELVQLENHFIAHKRLIKSLIDGIYPKILSEEIIDSAVEDHIDALLSSPSELEVHINDVKEKLDIYLSENRMDEALDLLESADEYYQNIQFEDDSPQTEIMLYKTMISDWKSTLISQLTQIAEHPKAAGQDLHKALAGLRRLGNGQLAVHLLLKHYHLRIATGTYNLKWSKSSSNGIYIRELARFVFSMISQAARSFVILCGENSSYASELLLWACEETKLFITFLDKYVKSISEISGGLSSTIQAVQFVVSYCSLLENQNLVLRPYLVRHLCPCMEEVLLLHINHFKKVIAIFSASDPWVLERYLASGVFGGGSAYLEVGRKPEYCLLTTSGRKFLTLLQAIIEDISPLVGLQMGSTVVSGLMKLFSEYIIILERALTHDTSVTEEVTLRIKLAESLPQQLSILANLSTVVQFIHVMVKTVFRITDHLDSNLVENHSAAYQLKELDDFLLFIEEGSNTLRYKFCEQFILRIMSTHRSHELNLTIDDDNLCDGNTIRNLMPSVVFQIFFLELRKLEQLAEEEVFEVDWLMGILREVMESTFIWVSQNKDIFASTKEYMSLEPDNSKQFVLDVQFLVEIGMFGGYFSSDPLLLLSLMKSTFLSAGLDPFRDLDNDGWAIDAATETIQKLLKIEKTNLPPEESVVTHEAALHENQSAHAAGDFSRGDYLSSSENDEDAKEDEPETVSLNIEQALENTESEKDDKKHDEVSCLAYSVGGVGENSEETKSKSEEHLVNKAVDGVSIGTSGPEGEESIGIEGQDVGDRVELDLH